MSGAHRVYELVPCSSILCFFGYMLSGHFFTLMEEGSMSMRVWVWVHVGRSWTDHHIIVNGLDSSPRPVLSRAGQVNVRHCVHATSYYVYSQDLYKSTSSLVCSVGFLQTGALICMPFLLVFIRYSYLCSQVFSNRCSYTGRCSY